MTEEEKRIENIDSKILKGERVIKKFKKNRPFAIGGGVVFSFIYPYIPGRHGCKPMIETWDYANAVGFMLVLYFAIYLIAYFYLIDKNKQEIESLKRTKITIKNKINKSKALWKLH